MGQTRHQILKEITPRLMEWYQQNARTLPWRTPPASNALPDPYHVWISEIMLQQTRVEAVRDYYERFLKRLPEVVDLAKVPEDELMKLWQGLGYYSRAKNLQKTAKIVMEEYDGIFPEEYKQLLKLPGIGEYTAGAISSIAFARPVPAVDGNVYRIYTRMFEDPSDITKAPVKREIRQQLETIIPKEAPGNFNQAWMDLGASICIPGGSPLCNKCPLQQDCGAFRNTSWYQYPVKPAKKPRQIQERTIFLLEYQGKYLLQKRPPKGLLAGLWEFPGQDQHLPPEDIQGLLQKWQVPGSQIELLGREKHIFSHVEWHMLGYLIHLHQLPEIAFSEESAWVSAKKIQKEYSIPSAFRPYYSKLFHNGSKA